MNYGYDDNGNLTSRGSDSLAWDHENRMTSATVAGSTTTYAYNGDGLRMSRTSGGNTVNYTWNVAGGMPVILQDGTYTYVYGPTGLLYWVDGSGNPTYRLTDGLGSTVALCEADGDVTDTFTYDVFGAERSHSGSNGTEFTFTGEQNDPNGLEYLRARYYDSATGRFLGRDPLGGGYPYAGNSPASMVDPTGLSAEGVWTFYNYTVQLWLPCELQVGLAALAVEPATAGLGDLALATLEISRHGLGLGLAIISGEFTDQLFSISAQVVFEGILPVYVSVTVDTPPLCLTVLTIAVACTTSWVTDSIVITPIPGLVTIDVALHSALLADPGLTAFAIVFPPLGVPIALIGPVTAHVQLGASFDGITCTTSSSVQVTGLALVALPSGNGHFCNVVP